MTLALALAVGLALVLFGAVLGVGVLLLLVGQSTRVKAAERLASVLSVPGHATPRQAPAQQQAEDSNAQPEHSHQSADEGKGATPAAKSSDERRADVPQDTREPVPQEPGSQTGATRSSASGMARSSSSGALHLLDGTQGSTELYRRNSFSEDGSSSEKQRYRTEASASQAAATEGSYLGSRLSGRLTASGTNLGASPASRPMRKSMPGNMLLPPGGHSDGPPGMQRRRQAGHAPPRSNFTALAAANRAVGHGRGVSCSGASQPLPQLHLQPQQLSGRMSSQGRGPTSPDRIAHGHKSPDQTAQPHVAQIADQDNIPLRRHSSDGTPDFLPSTSYALARGASRGRGHAPVAHAPVKQRTQVQAQAQAQAQGQGQEGGGSAVGSAAAPSARADSSVGDVAATKVRWNVLDQLCDSPGPTPPTSTLDTSVTPTPRPAPQNAAPSTQQHPTAVTSDSGSDSNSNSNSESGELLREYTMDPGRDGARSVGGQSASGCPLTVSMSGMVEVGQDDSGSSAESNVDQAALRSWQKLKEATDSGSPRTSASAGPSKQANVPYAFSFSGNRGRTSSTTGAAPWTGDAAAGWLAAPPVPPPRPPPGVARLSLERTSAPRPYVRRVDVFSEGPMSANDVIRTSAPSKPPSPTSPQAGGSAWLPVQRTSNSMVPGPAIPADLPASVIRGKRRTSSNQVMSGTPYGSGSLRTSPSNTTRRASSTGYSTGVDSGVDVSLPPPPPAAAAARARRASRRRSASQDGTLPAPDAAAAPRVPVAQPAAVQEVPEDHLSTQMSEDGFVTPPPCTYDIMAAAFGWHAVEEEEEIETPRLDTAGASAGAGSGGGGGSCAATACSGECDDETACDEEGDGAHVSRMEEETMAALTSGNVGRLIARTWMTGISGNLRPQGSSVYGSPGPVSDESDQTSHAETVATTSHDRMSDSCRASPFYVKPPVRPATATQPAVTAAAASTAAATPDDAASGGYDGSSPPPSFTTRSRSLLKSRSFTNGSNRQRNATDNGAAAGAQQDGDAADIRKKPSKAFKRAVSFKPQLEEDLEAVGRQSECGVGNLLGRRSECGLSTAGSRAFATASSRPLAELTPAAQPAQADAAAPAAAASADPAATTAAAAAAAVASHDSQSTAAGTSSSPQPDASEDVAAALSKSAETSPTRRNRPNRPQGIEVPQAPSPQQVSSDTSPANATNSQRHDALPSPQTPPAVAAARAMFPPPAPGASSSRPAASPERPQAATDGATATPQPSPAVRAGVAGGAADADVRASGGVMGGVPDRATGDTHTSSSVSVAPSAVGAAAAAAAGTALEDGPASNASAPTAARAERASGRARNGDRASRGSSRPTPRQGGAPALHYSDAPGHQGRIKVLLVSGDTAKMQAVREALPVKRYELQYSTGPECIRHITAENVYLPDVVLLDCHLGTALSGAPVLRRRKQSQALTNLQHADSHNSSSGQSLSMSTGPNSTLPEGTAAGVAAVAGTDRPTNATQPSDRPTGVTNDGRISTCSYTADRSTGLTSVSTDSALVPTSAPVDAAAAAAAAAAMRGASNRSSTSVSQSPFSSNSAHGSSNANNMSAMDLLLGLRQIYDPSTLSVIMLASLVQPQKMPARHNSAGGYPVAPPPGAAGAEGAEGGVVASLAAHTHAAHEGVAGLMHGANDYMVLPVLPVELEARINMQVTLRRAARIKAEASSSMQLLRAILPGHVIRKLKQGKKYIAQYHENVSIGFIDIVGFTRLSTTWPSSKVAHMLNDLFSRFDEICERQGVYHVDTIGDGYMVLCGHDGEKDHALKLIRAAHDMIEVTRQPLSSGEIINLRIGINTGPAHSGVLGTKRFKYTVWGDSVNCASRMESSGFPSCIQITSSTYHSATESMHAARAIEMARSSCGTAFTGRDWDSSDRGSHTSSNYMLRLESGGLELPHTGSSRGDSIRPSQRSSWAGSRQPHTCHSRSSRHSEIGSAREFQFLALGLREIKGKGLMPTYLVKVGGWQEAYQSLISQHHQHSSVPAVARGPLLAHTASGGTHPTSTLAPPDATSDSLTHKLRVSPPPPPRIGTTDEDLAPSNMPPTGLSAHPGQVAGSGPRSSSGLTPLGSGVVTSPVLNGSNAHTVVGLWRSLPPAHPITLANTTPLMQSSEYRGYSDRASSLVNSSRDSAPPSVNTSVMQEEYGRMQTRTEGSNRTSFGTQVLESGSDPWGSFDYWYSYLPEGGGSGNDTTPTNGVQIQMSPWAVNQGSNRSFTGAASSKDPLQRLFPRANQPGAAGHGTFKPPLSGLRQSASSVGPDDGLMMARRAQSITMGVRPESLAALRMGAVGKRTRAGIFAGREALRNAEQQNENRPTTVAEQLENALQTLLGPHCLDNLDPAKRSALVEWVHQQVVSNPSLPTVPSGFESNPGVTKSPPGAPSSLDDGVAKSSKPPSLTESSLLEAASKGLSGLLKKLSSVEDSKHQPPTAPTPKHQPPLLETVASREASWTARGANAIAELKAGLRTLVLTSGPSLTSGHGGLAAPGRTASPFEREVRFALDTVAAPAASASGQSEPGHSTHTGSFTGPGSSTGGATDKDRCDPLITFAHEVDPRDAAALTDGDLNSNSNLDSNEPWIVREDNDGVSSLFRPSRKNKSMSNLKALLKAAVKSVAGSSASSKRGSLRGDRSITNSTLGEDSVRNGSQYSDHPPAIMPKPRPRTKSMSGLWNAVSTGVSAVISRQVQSNSGASMWGPDSQLRPPQRVDSQALLGEIASPEQSRVFAAAILGRQPSMARRMSETSHFAPHPLASMRSAHSQTDMVARFHTPSSHGSSVSRPLQFRLTAHGTLEPGISRSSNETASVDGITQQKSDRVSASTSQYLHSPPPSQTQVLGRPPVPRRAATAASAALQPAVAAGSGPRGSSLNGTVSPTATSRRAAAKSTDGRAHDGSGSPRVAFRLAPTTPPAARATSPTIPSTNPPTTTNPTTAGPATPPTTSQDADTTNNALVVTPSSASADASSLAHVRSKLFVDTPGSPGRVVQTHGSRKSRLAGAHQLQTQSSTEEDPANQIQNQIQSVGPAGEASGSRSLLAGGGISSSLVGGSGDLLQAPGTQSLDGAHKSKESEAAMSSVSSVSKEPSDKKKKGLKTAMKWIKGKFA